MDEEHGIGIKVDVEIDNDIGIDSRIDTDEFQNNLPKKGHEPTENDFYKKYSNNFKNVHLVTSPWTKLPSTSVANNILWNKERDSEEVILFVGICNFMYLQDGENFYKVPWAVDEGSLYLSITIEESSFLKSTRVN